MQLSCESAGPRALEFAAWHMDRPARLSVRRTTRAIHPVGLDCHCVGPLRLICTRYRGLGAICRRNLQGDTGVDRFAAEQMIKRRSREIAPKARSTRDARAGRMQLHIWSHAARDAAARTGDGI